MSNENMQKVKAAMEAHAKVQMAGNLQEAVSINYESYEGNTYEGTVVFKKPTMGDWMRIGAIKADLLRKAGVTDMELVDDTVQLMAHAMATLTVVVIKRPPWFANLEEMTESDVIYHVYGKYMVWADSFRKPVQGAAAADSKDSEGAEFMDASKAPIRRDSADRPENTVDDGRAD